MINVGSFAQRNALDQWFNDPSLDHADQWSNEFLSRVDLIDHWSENGFARKERHRSEILIRILPKERTLRFFHWGYLWRKSKCPAVFLFLFPVFPFLFTASVTSWNIIDSTKVNFVKKKKKFKCFCFLWIHNRFLSPHPRLVSNKILGGHGCSIHWLFIQ